MPIDELARKKWLAIPSHVRKNIEENVFCGTCGGVTTVVDYEVDSNDFHIVLKGHCKKCNGDVARVVD